MSTDLGGSDKIIERERTVERHFIGISFDAPQIRDLALCVKRCLGSDSDRFSIYLTTSDEGEELRLRDPELLLGPGIPHRIGSVRVSASVGDLYCRISLDPARAVLSISGKEGVRVSSVAEEIGREVEMHRDEFSKMAQIFSKRRTWSRFVVGIALLWFYSVFLFYLTNPLLLIIIRATGITDRSLALLVSFSFGAVVALFGGIAAFATLAVLEGAFPPVRFKGDFFDVSTRYRKGLRFVLASIILPLILRFAYPYLFHG
jgi:hypothetical protein